MPEVCVKAGTVIDAPVNVVAVPPFSFIDPPEIEIPVYAWVPEVLVAPGRVIW